MKLISISFAVVAIALVPFTAASFLGNLTPRFNSINGPIIDHYGGVRVTYHSKQPFSVVQSRLFASVGNVAKFPSIAAQITPSTTPDDLAALVTPALGPHGFMFFAQFNHTAWLSVYKLPIMASDTEPVDYHRGILRVIVGNPLIATTMMHYDLTAGLAVPVEVLLLESKNRASCDVVYQLPSALIAGVNGNNDLVKAAKALDDGMRIFAEYLTI